MKSMVLIIFLAVVAAVTAIAMTLTPKPEVSDVKGMWLGTAKEQRFIGMELKTNGTGYICVTFPFTTAPYLYRIDNWRLTNFTVQLRAHPVGTDTPPSSFGKVQCSRNSLTIEIDKEKIELWREQDWQSRAAQVKQRIAEQNGKR